VCLAAARKAIASSLSCTLFPHFMIKTIKLSLFSFGTKKMFTISMSEKKVISMYENDEKKMKCEIK
jgi:hypothetical protein